MAIHIKVLSVESVKLRSFIFRKMFNDSKKYEYIDLLKLVMILVICLNHSIQYKWNIYKIVSNDVQNPMLIFASGIIFSYCINSLYKYKTFGDLIIKKSKRLLKPLFLVAVFYYMPLMKFANYFILVNKEYNKSIKEIIIGYVLGKNLNHLWYIYALFLMYIIMYWLNKFLIHNNLLLIKKIDDSKLLVDEDANKKLNSDILLNVSVYMILLIFLIICVIFNYKFTDLFLISSVARYFIFFFAGFLYDLYIEKCDKNNKIIRMLGVLGIIIVIYYIEYKYNFLAGDVFWGNKYLKKILQFIEIVKQFLMIYVIMSVIKTLYYKTRIAENKYINFLIQNSFNIYLFHQPLVKIMVAIKNYYFCISNDKVNFIVSLIISIVAVTLALIVTISIDRIRNLYKANTL